MFCRWQERLSQENVTARCSSWWASLEVMKINFYSLRGFHSKESFLRNVCLSQILNFVNPYLQVLGREMQNPWAWQKSHILPPRKMTIKVKYSSHCGLDIWWSQTNLPCSSSWSFLYLWGDLLEAVGRKWDMTLPYICQKYSSFINLQYST